MNKTRYVLAMLFSIGIGTSFSSAYAGAVVVAHAASPSYGMTTMRTSGSYVIHPTPCCYSSVVVRSAPSTVTVRAVAPPPPPVRVVYGTPVVITYPAANVVHVPTTVYVPVTHSYVP